MQPIGGMMQELNETMKSQIAMMFPEITGIINKLEKMPPEDRMFYLEIIFYTLVFNTRKTDAEILGILDRIKYKTNKDIDEVQKKRYGNSN